MATVALNESPMAATFWQTKIAPDKSQPSRLPSMTTLPGRGEALEGTGTARIS